MDSIFKIHVSRYISDEYLPMINDIVRFISIQFAIQLMLFSMNASMFPIMSVDFFLLLLFVAVGVMFYWLVVKKLLQFV